MNIKNKIMVTGGAGYIGSHTIIEILKDENFDVISVDNFSNSSPKTFERIKKITGKKVKNYNIDLCDFKQIKNVFKENPNIIGIIHFAAFKSVSDSVFDPLKYYFNNVNSLLNILKCVNEFKINYFIFSSSCSVYGNIKNNKVSESTPLQKAESPYAYTKQVGERIIEDFMYGKKSVSSIALRYFNPVGAHISGLIGEAPINAPNNLVPVITQTAIGKIKQLTVHGHDYDTRDGTCIRDYVHVSDIAKAHVQAIKHLFQKKNSKNYEIFNLGTGNGVSVLEAIQAFEKVSGTKLNYKIGPRREGDVEAICSDCSLAKEQLNWETEYNIDDMMKTAWQWEQNISAE